MSVYKTMINKVLRIVFAIIFVVSTCPILQAQQAFADEKEMTQDASLYTTDKEIDVITELERSNTEAEVQSDIQSTAWEECGTCKWRIDESGCLIIQPINGVSGTLSNWQNETNANPPWYSNRQSIVSVSIKNGVSALTTSSMFYNCTVLTSIDLSGLNTSNVTDMSRMFCGCTKLSTLNLSTLNTSNVVDMTRMFFECSSLTNLNLQGFNTSKATNMRYMFSYCESFASLDLSGFNTSNVTDMGGMFYGCTSLTSINLSRFNTAKVASMENMFHNCSALNSLNLSSFNTSNVTDVVCMFFGCTSLTSLDLSRFDLSKVTSMFSMFYNCSALTSLNLDDLDTSQVTNMDRTFYGCSSLTSLDFSDFDTSCVTNMYGMFEGCKSIKSIDLSSFDTSCVSNMRNMFCNCSSLVSLDLASFDTPQLTRTDYMFSSCRSLETIDLSSFNTQNVTSMECMFYFCESLKTLDISSFDTSKTTNMSRMFLDCFSLESVRLGLDFSFNGASETRLCNLPTNTKGGFSGRWKNSATGEFYASYEIPNNIEALYIADTSFMRIYGETRYDTMSEIISRGFETSDTVVLASGANFPDALSASALAGAYDAPVVLTEPSSLSEQAKDTIQTLNAKQIIIMGGESAISKTVENSLAILGLETKRIYGQTRQETSLKALDAVVQKNDIETVIIACSTGFADSLSVSPYSYSKKAPVVLADSDGTLSGQTVLSIKATGAKRAIIVGGGGVVSNQVESVLQDAGLLVERWSGENRYDTSTEIIKHELKEGLSLDLCAVSSGENFPDALSGGALVGKNNGILLLACENETQAIDSILGEYKDSVGMCYILGGTAAIPDTLKKYVQNTIYK